MKGEGPGPRGGGRALQGRINQETHGVASPQAGRNFAPAHKQTHMDIDVKQTSETGSTPAFSSPTGLPVIPPAAVPYLAVGYVVAVAAAEALPEHTVAAKVARVLVLVGGLLGLASPGLRR